MVTLRIGAIDVMVKTWRMNASVQQTCSRTCLEVVNFNINSLFLQEIGTSFDLRPMRKRASDQGNFDLRPMRKRHHGNFDVRPMRKRDKGNFDLRPMRKREQGNFDLRPMRKKRDQVENENLFDVRPMKRNFDIRTMKRSFDMKRSFESAPKILTRL